MKAAVEAWGASSNLSIRALPRKSRTQRRWRQRLPTQASCSNVPSAQIGPFDEESEVPTDLDLEKRPARSKAPKAARTPRAIQQGRRTTVRRRRPRRWPMRKRSAPKSRSAADRKRRMRRTVSGENVRWRERKPPLRRWNLNLRRALPPSKMSARDVEKRIKAEVARWDDLRNQLRDAVRHAGG